MKAAVFSVLMISWVGAGAANFVQLVGGENITVSVDADSLMSVKGGFRKAWIAHSYDKPLQTNDIYKKDYSAAIMLQRFNCSERTSATYQEVLYSGKDRQGNIVRTITMKPEEQALSDVVPGSVGEEVLNYVCAQKLRK